MTRKDGAVHGNLVAAATTVDVKTGDHRHARDRRRIHTFVAVDRKLTAHAHVADASGRR